MVFQPVLVGFLELIGGCKDQTMRASPNRLKQVVHEMLRRAESNDAEQD
jgi:hypothetical protein